MGTFILLLFYMLLLFVDFYFKKQQNGIESLGFLVSILQGGKKNQLIDFEDNHKLQPFIQHCKYKNWNHSVSSNKTKSVN